MELQEVNIHENKPLLFGKAQTEGLEETIECTYTAAGGNHKTSLVVNIVGDRKCPQSLVTFHDIGLNYVSNFSTLCNSEHMEQVRQKFCIYHINAPGMEENAEVLPDNFVYPSMENLADMIPDVLSKLNIKSAVFMGCGAGANVFMRFAMKNPSRVDGLVAVNAISSAVGTLSWMGEKLANIATPLHEQMLHYHFTREEAERANHDLIEAHRKHFQHGMNQHNLSLFIKEYERRDALVLQRPLDPTTPISEQHTLQCPTLLLVGDQSPFVEDVVEVNSRLNPTKTTLLKMADAGGMVMEEQTFKVTEALIYFLQGLGHMPTVVMSRLARSRTISMNSSEGGDDNKQRIRSVSEGDHIEQPGLSYAASAIEPHNDKTQLVSGAVC